MSNALRGIGGVESLREKLPPASGVVRVFEQIAAVPYAEVAAEETPSERGLVHRTANGGYLAVVAADDQRRLVFSPDHETPPRALPVSAAQCEILLVNPEGTSALVAGDQWLLYEVSLVTGGVKCVGLARGLRGAARMSANRVAVLRAGELVVLERRAGQVTPVAGLPCEGDSVNVVAEGRILVVLGSGRATFFGISDGELREMGSVDTDARHVVTRDGRVLLKGDDLYWEIRNLEAAYKNAF